MAPGPNGTLFVSIPKAGGTTLTLLGRGGSPLPGWPITVREALTCSHLLPVDDGSVRAVCTLMNPEGDRRQPLAAFAFDSTGDPLDGWPIALMSLDVAGRTTGDVLTLVTSDVTADGSGYSVGLVTIAANGAMRSGTPVPVVERSWFMNGWAIGPDAIAYGYLPSTTSPTVSRLTAIDLAGARAGWPISIDGIASGPGFGPDGRIYLSVAAPVAAGHVGTTRVFAIDAAGRVVAARSAELPITTGMLPPTSDGAFECGVPLPRPPIVAPDGAKFVFSNFDEAVYGLDSALTVMSGWPIAAGSIERPDPWLGSGGISCPWVAVPAVGPDGTLYLPLRARNESVGGRLVAVGPDGRTRPGWPVELRRAGSEFWSVVVGPDGISYALAIEPEANGGSSATILAIAPNSTMIYTRTILEP